MSDQGIKGRFDELTAERDQLKAENKRLMKLLERTNAYIQTLAEISDGVTNGLRNLRDTMRPGGVSDGISH